MDEEMKTILAEGGIADDGMNKDPISGNEIPAGSLAKEVRDDVDAKLSEGEYVVPADVVRYFGVNYFEKLRQKAKAGLEEMDKDGRIGGDPVGAPMGDMDEALSDEEMAVLNEMFKGGFVTSAGYQEGGDVTRNVNSQFQPPQSIFATSPAPAPAVTPTTLYGPSGDVMVLMLPTEQDRYNQLISEGYSTKPIETPTSGDTATTTGSDRDRSQSAIATPEVTEGEGFDFSLGEDEAKALSDDPLAFGAGALGGDRLLSSRTLAGVGTMGGLPGMLLGGGVGAALELQDVAKARAALLLAKDRNLEDTPEFLALERDLREKEKGMNFATRLLDRTGLFSGEGYVKSASQTPTIAPMTPQAIPTGPSGSTRSTTDSGVTYDTTRTTGSDGRVTERSTIAEGTSAAPTKSVRPVARPPRAPAAATRGVETAEARERAKKAADRQGTSLATGGRAKGGLVQRPKKKRVAKK